MGAKKDKTTTTAGGSKSSKGEQAPTKDWAAVKDKGAKQPAAAEAQPAQPKDEQTAAKPAAASTQSTDKLEQETNRLKEQLADYKDIVLRSKAEVENMRLRTQKEVERAHAFGLERFAKGLLPVVDSLEQAMTAHADDPQGSGLKITHDMFIKALAGFHLVQVAAEGELFDASVHEAISVQPSESVESNHIVNVVRTGYTLNGRVIRAAMVVVAK